MNSKGQIAGQVFIYMMAVIVIGGIALVGYSAIKNITGKSCDVEKITFKSDMENLIEKYTSYGSVNKKTLRAPCEYDTVCFVDATMIGSDATGFSCANRMIADSVANNVEQNIFVISNKKTIPIGYSTLVRLKPENQGTCLCITQRSKNFYITFEGFGSYTQISQGQLS
jgi:hypothetical protein